MKLSLCLIAEWLNCFENKEIYGNLADFMCLDRVEFYTGETCLQSHILYISTAKNLPKELVIPAESALICIGKSPFADSGRCLELSAKKTDVFRLSNEIHGIFRRFDQWEQEMNRLSSSPSRRDVFQEILDVSDPVFENGLSLMNSSFKLLALTETTLKFGKYETITDHYDPGDVSADIMSMLRNNAEYQIIASTREVSILDDSILPYRTMTRNIYLNEQFAYRIAVTECMRPFRRSDEALLIILSDYIQKIADPVQDVPDVYNQALAGFLEDMIRKDIVNKAALDMELATIGWHAQDLYCVLCLNSVQVSREDNTGFYYCLEIMREFRGSFALLIDQKIAVVFNQTVAGTKLQDFLQAFAVFIRDHNFRAGTSNTFRDIYRVRKYYRQAEIVLDIGQNENPSVWRHNFSDYVLTYILNIATAEFEREELYSPIYYRLQNYDAENGTELLKTLKCYLEHNMNTVQTAQELFIHRSTMIYRLKRIVEIGQSDLTDQEELLHLQLTFHLIST